MASRKVALLLLLAIANALTLPQGGTPQLLPTFKEGDEGDQGQSASELLHKIREQINQGEGAAYKHEEAGDRDQSEHAEQNNENNGEQNNENEHAEQNNENNGEGNGEGSNDGKPELISIEKGEPELAPSPSEITASSLRDMLKDSSLATSEFSHSIHDFTQNFLSKVSKKEENLVFSPLSLHVALAMLASGATPDSETQVQLINALGRTANIAALQQRYADLLKEYEELPEIFQVGNRLWLPPQENVRILDSFKEMLTDVFSSDLQKLENTGVDGANEVNQWVSERTKGKIDKLFEELSPELSLLLTNVIYFKDAWTVPFEHIKNEEEKPEFQLVDGSKLGKSDLTWMRRSSFEFGLKEFAFKSLPDIKFTVVSIPYKFNFGDRFEMLLVTPSSRPQDLLILEDHLQRLSEQNNGDNVLDEIDEQMFSSDAFVNEVALVMPEFTVESKKLDVPAALRAMGVNGIFELGQFHAITADRPLKVGQVAHKAIVEVDREGTVGAAATGVELVPLSGAFVEPREVVVDKPFLFVVRDKQKKVPIFIGSIKNPKEN